MQHQRTQIYLDPSQHAALLQEARRLSISLAGLIRKLVDEHFSHKRNAAPDAESRRSAALSLIGLGSSGFQDVSVNKDRYLAEAVDADRVKERRGAYEKGRRRKSR